MCSVGWTFGRHCIHRSGVSGLSRQGRCKWPDSWSARWPRKTFGVFASSALPTRIFKGHIMFHDPSMHCVDRTEGTRLSRLLPRNMVLGADGRNCPRDSVVVLREFTPEDTLCP